MNTIIIDGNLTKDAENRLVGEKNVITFNIANNEGTNDNPETTFVKCVCWSSEKLGNILTKGTRVLIHGRLKIREKDGKYYTEIIANSYKGITFIGGKRNNDPEQLPFSDADEFTPVDDGDNLPF